MISITIGSEILICRDDFQAGIIESALIGTRAVVIYSTEEDGTIVAGKIAYPKISRVNVRMYKEAI